LSGWQSAETKLEAGRNSAFHCPNCGVVYSEDQRIEMNEGARLLHRGQEVTEEGEIVGSIVETDTFSLRVSAFNNLFTDAERLGQDEWAAANSEDAKNAEKKMRQFIHALPIKGDN